MQRERTKLFFGLFIGNVSKSQWQWTKEDSYFVSQLHTFLLLYPKKQHCGTQDVDDADDSRSNQVGSFLGAERRRQLGPFSS